MKNIVTVTKGKSSPPLSNCTPDTVHNQDRHLGFPAKIRPENHLESDNTIGMFFFLFWFRPTVIYDIQTIQSRFRTKAIQTIQTMYTTL